MWYVHIWRFYIEICVHLNILYKIVCFVKYTQIYTVNMLKQKPKIERNVQKHTKT